MIILVNQYPAYIDDFLQAYLGAIKIESKDPPPLGDSLIEQLSIESAEIRSSGYRARDSWQTIKSPSKEFPGKIHPLDCSNIKFSKEDVEENFDNVFNAIKQQAGSANDFIVSVALFARYSV